MIIKWSVEGSGCNSARCGLPDFELEIDDEDLYGLDASAKGQLIDDRVNEEFRMNVYPFWEIKS